MWRELILSRILWCCRFVLIMPYVLLKKIPRERNLPTRIYCLKIFEGQSEFVAEAMQVFGYLHAAAIGLDIQLQCFISGSSSTTDIIIADCILELKRSRKATSFPAMLEAKTFAESFLTEFASINALTAHAILSCGVEFWRFMSLKVEEQLRVTALFDLPQRSLALFKQQCQSGSSGRLSKGAKWMCSEDHLRINQSKMRNFLPPSSKVSPLKEKLTQCKQNHLSDEQEKEWHSQKAPRKVSVDDFLHPDCNLWPVENEDHQDGEHACSRESLKDMNFAKGRLPFDSPVQKGKTPSVSQIYDRKLERTMDLILKRNDHPYGKEGFKATGGAKGCEKSPVDKDTRSSWFELEQVSSPNAWIYSPVGSVLSPEVAPENIVKLDTAQLNDARRSSCNQKNFQRSLHSFPQLSPKLKRTQELHKSFISEQVHKKQIEVDIEDLFENQLNEDLNRQNEKECPVEFANETRAHLKRKLDFDSPATAKRIKRSPQEEQKISKASFFDRYRYEGKEKQYEIQKTYSGKVSGTNLFNSPREHSQQDAYREKRLSTGRRSLPNVQRNTYTNFKRCSPVTKHDAYRSPAQSKGLSPSWTPYDKRSKKILSFAKEGNNRQSRLVWESSQDVSKRGNSLSPLQKF